MLSFGPETQEIIFDSPVTQLTGKNGAGKSSIPTILEELFYNKNSRGVKKAEIPNRHSDKKHYLCAAWFSKDGDEYSIHKVVKTTTSLKLVKNGEDISGHTATQTYDILEKLIGLDFNTFSKLVYQSMVSSLDFLTATDANRKKFLVSLLGLERYQEVQEQLKSAASEAKQQYTADKARVEFLENNIFGYKDEQFAVEIPVPDIDEKIAELQKSIYDAQSTMQTISASNKSILENNKLISQVDSLRKELNCYVSQKPARTSAEVQLEKTTIEVQHKAVLSEHKKISEAKTHCPMCNKPYEGDFSHQKQKLGELAAQATALAEKHKQVKHELEVAQSYEKYSTKLTQIQELDSKIDSTKPTQIHSVEELEKTVTVCTTEISSLRNSHALAVAANKAAAVKNAGILARREQVNKFKEELELALKNKISSEDRSTKLTVLTDAYGTKGLISYKIETLVKVFESLINQYLQLLSDGKFVLTFAVEDTKLALRLYDDGHEISIGQVSSGEFNKINTATLLAVRRMMTSLSKVDINVLFLDEVVSVLDTESKDNLVEVLLKEPKMNSIVVSHGYKHPLARTVTVVKEGNISRLHNE